MPKVLILAGCCVLSGCGAAVYRPAGANFATSITAMNTATAQAFKEYRAESRTALIKKTPSTPWSTVLCFPFANWAYYAAAQRELQLASAGITNLTGDSADSFSGLVAATAGSYAVIPDRGKEEESENALLKQAKEAENSCQADIKSDALVQTREAFLARVGSGQGTQGIAGAIALWELIKPIAEGGLRFVDQRRRERAIHEYLQAHGQDLLDHIRRVQAFMVTKNKYERALAAQEFKTALNAAAPGGFSDKELEELHKQAAVYDAVFDQSPEAPFKDLTKAVERLRSVASGKYTGEDLAAAIKGFGSAAASLAKIREQIAELEKGGDKNDELKAALKKLREGV